MLTVLNRARTYRDFTAARGRADGARLLFMWVVLNCKKRLDQVAGCRETRRTDDRPVSVRGGPRPEIRVLR